MGTAFSYAGVQAEKSGFYSNEGYVGYYREHFTTLKNNSQCNLEIKFLLIISLIMNYNKTNLVILNIYYINSFSV